MLHLLALLLLAIFLTALSGFWLGYFLGKTVTLKQTADSLERAYQITDDVISLTNEHNPATKDELISNLIDLCDKLALDKPIPRWYNEPIARYYKRTHKPITEKENNYYEKDLQSVD